MAQTKSKVEDLVLWASNVGTMLHPHVEIYEDVITGLSFRAVKDLCTGTNLVTVNCSNGAMLSYLNAIDAPSFPSHASTLPRVFLDALGPEEPNVIGYFFLVEQYLLGEKSFWWPYIRLLPQPDQPSSIPALWPEADQRYLDGTNVEPAIKKRTDMWQQEWERGILLLRDGLEGWEEYTYAIYKWAASIFSSRSFRPSLTLPEVLIPNHLEPVRKDKFSILLPVLDIGNHNGISNVSWIPDPITGIFLLSSRGSIRQNEQIFNYYGHKSNSELLAGYGFTLPTTPNLDRDVVNLKLKPGAEALALRRSQRSHVIPSVAEEEFMFAVQKRIDRGNDGRLKDFEAFSDGLVELVLCMVANKRESKYLSRNPDYCPEKDPNVMESPLARALLMTLQILNVKLVSEHGRMTLSSSLRREPQNANQRIALDYTIRQISVASVVSAQLTTRFNAALSFSTFGPMHEHTELLSLECAYDWLRINYDRVHSSIVQMISEDQDEPLPLNWNVLVEDWDHTYWIGWIFVVWLLWARDGELFRLRHPSLSTWLVYMNSAYDDELKLSPGSEVLHADYSEKETIELMIQGIMGLAEFSAVDIQKWLHSHSQQTGVVVATRLCNFASFVAREETFTANYQFPARGPDEVVNGLEEVPDQKLLCILKKRDSQIQEEPGSWITCMSRSPGFQKGLNDQISERSWL